jgi:hypothetical protein
MKKLAVLMLGAVLAASTVGAGVAPKDSDAAVRTLRRQIGYVNDGQYDLAYRQIHPAQQALFSVDQYSRFLQEGFGGAKITLDKVKKTYRSTLTIPGTDVRARTVAVTVELTVKQGIREEQATYTYHEGKVRGHWKLFVDDGSLRMMGVEQ